MGVASQDFRDGMASGARLLRDNIAIARGMGLELDRHHIAGMANHIADIYGGNSRADLPGEDDEQFCSGCLAGVDSDEHHGKCVVTGRAQDGESA